MVRIVSIALVTLSLGGCATASSDWNALTGVVGSVINGSVPRKTVYLAANEYDTLEVAATGYLNFCRTSPGAKVSQICAPGAISQLIPAVRAGRVARNNLLSYLKANPGKLGPSGLFKALQAAASTLQGVIAAYNIKVTT